MILIGCALGALFPGGLWGWKKGCWLLWCFVFSVLGPQIANQVGWAVAEMGRQPWIVYGILRTEHAVSPPLTAAEALSSLGMFFVIYALLLALFLYQITHKIHKGPDQEANEDDGTGEGKLQVPSSKTNLQPLLKPCWTILLLQTCKSSGSSSSACLGPVWDGNEVWLITGGGALFAAFPYVYASVFSGFYLAFMLLLLTLIFRAVSIEFPEQAAHEMVAQGGTPPSPSAASWLPCSSA